MRPSVTSIATIVACAWHLTAVAQALPDPTRPALLPRGSGEGAAAAPVPAAPAPVLQSVLIARDRSIAIISGQRFDLGDHVGDARIVRITETEVVLRSGDAQTTLKLFPQVEKRNRPHGNKPAGMSRPPRKSAMTTRETEA